MTVWEGELVWFVAVPSRVDPPLRASARAGDFFLLFFLLRVLLRACLHASRSCLEKRSCTRAAEDLPFWEVSLRVRFVEARRCSQKRASLMSWSLASLFAQASRVGPMKSFPPNDVECLSTRSTRKYGKYGGGNE